MKNFFLHLTILFSTISYANHTGASFLSYQYIGDSTGVAHQYKVTFAYFSDVSPNIPMRPGSTIDVHIKSSCYSDRIFQLNRISPANPHPVDTNGSLISSNYGCANTAFDFAFYQFSANVILPGTCTDFQFIVEPQCCGIPYNNFGLTVSSAYATLDNSTKENNLPLPDARFFSARLCLGKRVNLRQPISYDSTSNNFKVIDLKMGKTLVPQYWATSYSTSNPIDTDTSGFTILTNGTLSFVPARIGNFLIPMEYKNFDTLNGQNYLAGTMNYLLVIEVMANCDSAVTIGPDFHFQNQSTSSTAQCSDSTLVLHYSNNWDPASLSPDFSEFKVSYAKRNINVPIKRVEQMDSSRLKLVFTDTLRINDTLTITTQTGSDGDGLLNYCNYGQDNPDTLLVDVVGCINVSVKEAIAWNKMEIYPNPAGEKLFLNDPLLRKIQSLTITNASGAPIKVLGEPKGHIELGDISSGLYWFVFTFSDGAKEAHKVIIR